MSFLTLLTKKIFQTWGIVIFFFFLKIKKKGKTTLLFVGVGPVTGNKLVFIFAYVLESQPRSVFD